MNGDLRIGTWLVQPSLNTISQNGTRRQLEPKVMEVLACLARHAGETVSKEQLIKEVWSDTFVSDDVLVRSISEIRRAFEDDPRESRCVQTIPKRGYRLIADVKPAEESSASGPGAPGQVPRANEFRLRKRSLRIGIAIGSAAVIAVVALLAFQPARESPPQIRSIAVLPLDNLSGDPAQEYFADGMTEELITDLSQFSTLRVASHRSVLRYRKSEKTVPEIAGELHVDAVIEGSVQRIGNRVRITAQLIYAPQDKNIFAKSYERDFGDALTLQATVAAAIAHEIRVTLTEEEKARLIPKGPVNPKALDDYMEGRYQGIQTFVSTFTKLPPGSITVQDEYRTAVSLLKRAIQEDPNFAEAYVELANTDTQGPVDAAHISEKKTLVAKALSLDPSNLRAHLLRADQLRLYDANWAAAGEELRRSIELYPNSVEAHDAYAGYLDDLGRHEEGLREHEHAQALDPEHDYLSDSPLTPIAERLERKNAFMQQNGADFGDYYGRAKLEYENGQYVEAVKDWQTEARRLGWNEEANAWGRAFSHGGPRAFLTAYARFCNDVVKHQKIGFMVVAEVNRYAGNKEQALAALESGYEQRDPYVLHLRSYYLWDSYRSEPRFQAILRRVGLTP